jgi:transcriptional regulator with XRE-family HTH domain
MRTAGRIIREKREKMGQTVQVLADFAGVSKATMSRIETGQRIPCDSEIKTIAEVLGIEYTFLISAFDAQRQAVANAKALLFT